MMTINKNYVESWIYDWIMSCDEMKFAMFFTVHSPDHPKHQKKEKLVAERIARDFISIHS